MNRSMLLLIVAMAACGGPAKSTGPLPTGSGNAGVIAHDAVCPDDATLVAELTALWKIAPPQKIELHECAAGRFGVPGLIVTAWVDTFESGTEEFPVDSEMRRVVLDAQRNVLAQAEPESLAPWYRAEGGGAGRAEMIDFDGDGVEEILEQQTASHGGSSTEWITVRRIAGTELKEIFSLQLNYDIGAATEDELAYLTCTGTRSIVEAGAAHLLVVEATITRGPHASAESEMDCVSPGRHTYGLVGDEFKELP